MSLLVSSSTIATSVPSDSQEAQDRVVLILCGLIASGKSTFAEALQRHDPRFRRCNQDELGDRRAVEQLAREHLENGLSICIDRTNFNAAQRAYWIDIAREFPGTKVWVIVFDTPFATCAERLQTRTGHPTIKSPKEGLAVLTRFAADFRPPRPHEGYHRILFLQPADHPAAEYTAADIAGILTRVRNAPPIVPPPPQAQDLQSRRGGGRGGRGGYYGGYAGGHAPEYNRSHTHSHRPAHRAGNGHDAGPNTGYQVRGGNTGSRGRGRTLRGAWYVNQYPDVFAPMQQGSYYGAGSGRGRGSYYAGGYRGDGVGLSGARPVYVAHSDTGAGSASAPSPARGSQSDAGADNTGGREDVLPIDD